MLTAVLVACGSSAHGVATGSKVSTSLPATTAPPTATPSPTDSPSPTASPSATPSPTATPTPLATALPQPSATPYIVPASDANGAEDVGQYVYSSIAGVACGGRTHHYDNCPLTSRLIQRLDSNPLPGGEPLCRCQNYWQQSSLTVTETPDPMIWIDHIVLNFGSQFQPIKIDLRVLQTSSGWVGDDTTCTGQGEESSIYVDNPPLCSS
jgi:hypothetical protein